MESVCYKQDWCQPFFQKVQSELRGGVCAQKECLILWGFSICPRRVETEYYPLRWSDIFAPGSGDIFPELMWFQRDCLRIKPPFSRLTDSAGCRVCKICCRERSWSVGLQLQTAHIPKSSSRNKTCGERSLIWACEPDWKGWEFLFEIRSGSCSIPFVCL